MSRIPNFDPTQLPFWDIYVNEGKDSSILVGGQMGSESFAGLSGGQRKMLLFELIYQRTAGATGLLLVFDEPFAGITDDFVPYIEERLTALRQNHNVLVRETRAHRAHSKLRVLCVKNTLQMSLTLQICIPVSCADCDQ